MRFLSFLFFIAGVYSVTILRDLANYVNSDFKFHNDAPCIPPAKASG